MSAETTSPPITEPVDPKLSRSMAHPFGNPFGSFDQRAGLVRHPTSVPHEDQKRPGTTRN